MECGLRNVHLAERLFKKTHMDSVCLPVFIGQGTWSNFHRDCQDLCLVELVLQGFSLNKSLNYVSTTITCACFTLQHKGFWRDWKTVSYGWKIKTRGSPLTGLGSDHRDQNNLGLEWTGPKGISRQCPGNGDYWSTDRRQKGHISWL